MRLRSSRRTSCWPGWRPRSWRRPRPASRRSGAARCARRLHCGATPGHTRALSAPTDPPTPPCAARSLAATRDELGAENFKLTTEVDRQRSTLRDINEHLTSELKAAKQRVAALETQLADAQQELAAAASKAQVRVAAGRGPTALHVHALLTSGGAPVIRAGLASLLRLPHRGPYITHNHPAG